MLRTFKTVLSIIFCGLTFLPLKILAQGDQTDAALAKELVIMAEEVLASTKAMLQARDMYIQAAQLDPNNIKAHWKAGEFYLETVGKDQAAQYFERVHELDPEYRFDLFYWTGRSYQYGMNFKKALEYYEKYKDKLISFEGYRGRDKVELPDVERKIFECRNGLQYVANPSQHSIVNVGPEINSEEDDYAPVLNADEDFIIFTSRRRDGNLNENVFIDNKPFEDIFYSRKEGGKWTKAQNIGETINTNFHDSNLAISADAEQLFIYKDDNNGDIYVSYRTGEGWSYPEPLNENINSEGFKEGSISISPDGKVLFFASNRIGGFGGMDIYYSIKNSKGEWERSKNLGPMINTKFDDDGPFIDYDGKTLYFSSQGRQGMGGHDIFYSIYDSASSEWSEPVNLGYPINTPDNDIYFVSTRGGKRGYYASVREDGYGFTDIYMVTVEKPEEGETIASKGNEISLQPVNITIKVVDNETKEPLDAQVMLRRRSDNIMAGILSKGTGIFESNITNSSESTYQLSVEKDGYSFRNKDINIPAATEERQELVQTIEMNKLRIGTGAVLRNIYFDFNKATFQQSSFNELNKLERMMKQNPGLRIQISGHTDRIGTAQYNKKLSQQRANAVKNHLVKNGIDPRRIQTKGYGEERPLASNDDELEGRELNRRVEFQVIR